MAAKAFGKLQGAPIRGRAVPQRAANVTTAAVYEAPRPSNYDDIVGNAFQGGYHAESYEGMGTYATPVVGLRFVSCIIDFVILMVLTIFVGAFFSIFTGGGNASVDPAAATGITITIFFAIITLWFGYGIVLEASRFQGTFGKVLTGTVVVNKDGSALSFGQVIGRNFGKILSGLMPFYIPYFMVFFTENNQSLHDLMCGSYVYRKSDLSRSSGHVFD